jgi:hypothetical protein
LWLIDDARFARADKTNALTAQALRRITSEGSSPTTSVFNGSHNNGFGHSLDQLSANLQGMRSCTSSRLPSAMLSLDGSQGTFTGPDTHLMEPVLSMIGMTTQSQPLVRDRLPALTLQIPTRSQYPGYPTAQSPTSAAKRWFPSPASECAGAAPTPRPGSPMSIDGSDMCGPSRRCASHNIEHYRDQTIFNDVSDRTAEHVALPGYPPLAFRPEAKIGGMPITSPPLSTCGSQADSVTSPTSPMRPISPRTAMLKNMVGKRTLQGTNYQPNLLPPYMTAHTSILPDLTRYVSTSFNPWNLNSNPFALPTSPTSPTTPTSPNSIEIANGIETSCVSPISPSGTMLQYTSYRPVDSGLLAVKPLSEAQVAEYRFWRPCGRRTCSIGCGAGNEGEVAAARRLFRDVSEVVEEDEGEVSEDSGYHDGERGVQGGRRRTDSGYVVNMREGVADI